jgi:hypothetical protein
MCPDRMAADRPPWLEEEPEICALLHAGLDRFDRQRGSERQRRIHLSLHEHVPSLVRADAAADQTWNLIKELERRGVIEIRCAVRSPYDLDWKGAKIALSPEIESTLRTWLDRDYSEPAAAIWRRAILRHAHVFEDGGASLLTQRIVIENRSAEDVVAAFWAAAAMTSPMTLRQLSATLFWGDSKVLDDRAELVAALLPRLPIRDRTLVVAVHLPRHCRGVLFVENQDTYTAAAGGTPREAGELAVVFAAGFRGTAARVRHRSGALLHFAGTGLREHAQGFESWWYDDGPSFGPSWFWGDLDFAGMQILKALRSRFPAMGAWPAGYGPMLGQLQSRGGYGAAAAAAAAAAAVAVGQVDPGTTGCDYADGELLPAIRLHGRRDQEGQR